MNAATANGVFCCTAAGNEGHDNDPTTSHLGAPADGRPKRFVAMCASLGFHAPFLFPARRKRWSNGGQGNPARARDKGTLYFSGECKSALADMPDGSNDGIEEPGSPLITV